MLFKLSQLSATKKFNPCFNIIRGILFLSVLTPGVLIPGVLFSDTAPASSSHSAVMPAVSLLKPVAPVAPVLNNLNQLNPDLSAGFSRFTIQKITLTGLSHLPESAVSSSISVHVGDVLTPDLSNQLISNLFKTGYFTHIQLLQGVGADSQTLIINFTEAPTIAEISIKGNSLIKTQQIKDVLLKVGLQVGDMLNPSTLLRIQQSLEEQYETLGKYPATVKTETENLPRNRVKLKIVISEGLDTKVARIDFVGNQYFKTNDLLDNFTLSTPSLWTIFNSDDEFTQAKMSQSVQTLSDYYTDNGFLKYHINSSEAALTSTKKQALLTISMTEGALYHFGKIDLQGQFVIPKEDLQKLILIHQGGIFSRSDVLNSAKAMQLAMANKGYAFATVNPIPSIDDKTKIVGINFYINPGNRVYIHEVRFNGNTQTNDKTLRQRVLFSEGSLYNQTKIDQSKLKFQQLPFVQNVSEDLVPVPGSTDQVDIVFKITEQNANKVGGSIGYSELDHLILGANLTMPNLFGTGDIFQIAMQWSQPYQSVNFTFTQPYFTNSGISQSVNLYVSKLDQSHLSVVGYSMNQVGANLTYGIPLSTFNTFSIGAGVDHSHLLNPYDSTSLTVQQFTSEWGNNFNSLTMNFGWSHDSTNDPYFPSIGTQGSIGGKVTAPISTVNWYKTYMNGAWFHPVIWDRLVFGVNGEVDYGNGYGKLNNLPFYQNYYGGGWGSVRGYEQGSLGPDDTIVCGSDASDLGCTSRGDALGGNLKVDASANLYFPVPFAYSQKNLRMGVFADAGNVYNTYHLSTAYDSENDPTRPNFDNLRYSVGLELQWQSPIGALGFSLAEPLNKKPGDDTNIFQFNLGQTF